MSTAPTLLRFFRHDHLPSRLGEVARPYAELAQRLCGHMDSPTVDRDELLVALRKLLEAKDATVRSFLSCAAGSV